MRALWVVLLLAPAMSGCLSFLDDEPSEEGIGPAKDVPDPSLIKISGVREWGSLEDPIEVLAHDGVELSLIAYEPLSQSALPGGGAPTFPVVVFIHGFGLTKEMWLCPPEGDPGPPSMENQCVYDNMLQDFANEGFIAVAYDARGFGRSGGEVTVAGQREMRDLDTIIDWAEANTATNGKVGVTGISYGGGHALLALTTNPRVDTIAAHQGWFDLYESLAPGNVPKAEWIAALVGEGIIGSGGRMHDDVYGWMQSAAQRSGMAEVRRDLDIRSPADLLGATDKPLLVCMGMQETLFPDIDDFWNTAGGFIRAIVHHGGHGAIDPTCWDATQDWFAFFLRGVDTQVGDWPALQTVDANGGDMISFDPFPEPVWQTYHLRAPQLTEYEGSNATFTIQQRLLSNPLQEPSAVWDVAGQNNQAIPYSMRFAENDPTAVFFESARTDTSQVLVGSAELDLHVAPASQNTAWQVTAQLIHVDIDDSSRILARGAYSHIPGETPTLEGAAPLSFHFTKAEIAPGSMLVLKISANDLSWFAPYQANYSVDFTGHSELRVPFFEP